MIAAERETIVNASDYDGEVRIWTAQRKFITALKRKGASVIAEGSFEGSPWAEFRIPADAWSPATGMKRAYNMSVEERQRRADRLRGGKINQ